MNSDEIYLSLSKMKFSDQPLILRINQISYDLLMGNRKRATATTEGVARALDRIASERVIWKNGRMVSVWPPLKFQRGAWLERQRPKLESLIHYD